MADNILIAIQITVVGMSLVFGSIVLLWVVMAALVRVSSTKEPAEQRESAAEMPDGEAELNARRKRAAAAAVAVLLTKYRTYQEPHELNLPPTAIVSAWQAVLRSSNVRQRGPIRR